MSSPSDIFLLECHENLPLGAPDVILVVQRVYQSPPGEGRAAGSCPQRLVLDGSIFVILPTTGWVTGSSQMLEITNN